MQKNIIDSLKIIREIGKGGFGKVYLVQDENENYFALKVINCDNASLYNKELNALNIYKKLSANAKDFNIIPILDVKIEKEKISYLMPLADPMLPTLQVENYKPKTLMNLAKERYSSTGFFKAKEILDIFAPLSKAADFLNDNGIIHRDIKPDNILFINNKAYIADIGLMRDDTLSASSAGTKDYKAPSWFIKTNGKVDMWGLATTLYLFYTGNSPDTLGRANFRYPEAKDKIPSEDILAYEHFNRVIFRALHDNAKERYFRFESFYNDLKNIRSKEDFEKNKIKSEESENEIRAKTSIFSFKGRLSKKIFVLCFVLFYIAQNSMPYWTDIFFDFLNISPIFFGLLINYPLLMICIKRVHDAGFSGKWAVLGFFTYLFCKVLNIIIMEIKGEFLAIDFASPFLAEIFITAFSISIFASLKSDKATNKYGVPNQKLSFF